MRNKYVFVVDRHGEPLMPTTRFGHVRKLLKGGLAVPIKNEPFTIRLKYDSKTFTQDADEGIDPGRENVGNAVSLSDGRCALLEDIRTNNRSVKSNMQDRSGFRSQRRRHDRQNKQRKARHDGTEIQNGEDCVALHNKDSKSVAISYPGADKPVEHKVIRGKEGKFNNRKRPDGWLTPSARQLIQCMMNTVKSTCEILPITTVHVEMNAFDFQRLEDENIHDWNHGKLFGFKDYKDYIWHEQHGKCAVCGAPITQCHHIVPRSRNGVDNVRNIIGLCDSCHREVHNNPDAAEQLKELKSGIVKEYQVGLLNSVMPAFIEELYRFCDPRGIKVVITHGKDTKTARDKLNLPKDHCVDAYAISLSDRVDSITKSDVSLTDPVLVKRRFKKKSGNITAARNQRVYRYEGKDVAYNRHKAMDQKKDSLEEYMTAYAMAHTDAECAEHFRQLEIISAKRTYTFHKKQLIAPAHPGDIVRYEKHNKVKGNTKTATVAATSVSYKQENDGSYQWHIDYGDRDQSVKAKYCRPISSGCIQVVKTCTVADGVEESAKQEAAMRKRHERNKQK